MFESTVELIAQAASNSLVIFCFCNLIIVMILMGSKPVSNFGQESEIPQSMVTKTHTKVKEDVLAMPSFDENKKPSLDEDKMSADDGRVSITLEEPTGDDDEEENGNDNEEDEDEDEDELRRELKNLSTRSIMDGGQNYQGTMFSLRNNLIGVYEGLVNNLEI